MAPFFKIPKIRSKEHREYVASRASILSGARGQVAYCLGDSEGVDDCDSLAIPLTNFELDMLRRSKNEAVFFANFGLDYEALIGHVRRMCRNSPCDKMRELNGSIL